MFLLMKESTFNFINKSVVFIAASALIAYVVINIMDRL